MKLDEGLDQAEAQPDAALAELVVSGRVAQRVEAGEEWLEEVLLVAGCDAQPLVADLDADLVGRLRLGAGFDADRAAVGRELDRVGQQIDQDVGDLGRVDLDRAQVGIDIDGDRLLPQLEIGRELFDRRARRSAAARAARCRATG